MNNDDVPVLHQQLKTVSVRDSNRCNNVDIPDAGDENAKVQALNCQLISSRHGQEDDRTKTTKMLQSVSSDCNLPGRSTADITSIAGSCTPESQNTANVHNSSAVDCHVSMMSADSCNVPTVRLDTDTTSAEAPQAAGAAKKKKKTVTFSDNVELVASAADVTDPVDYMSYAASIGRQANLGCTAKSSADSLSTTKMTADMLSTCTNSDTATASDSSDEMDVENCMAPSGQVRCSLCRQKWVELTDTYCSDCCFYLSKLQPST